MMRSMSLIQIFIYAKHGVESIEILHHNFIRLKGVLFTVLAFLTFFIGPQEHVTDVVYDHQNDKCYPLDELYLAGTA